MKATIDVPDELYRQVKAKTALQGLAIREVTVELYQRWLAEEEKEVSAKFTGYAALRENASTYSGILMDAPASHLNMQSAYAVKEKPGGRFADGCGIVSSGVGDLSSNPKHLEGFGRE